MKNYILVISLCICSISFLTCEKETKHGIEPGLRLCINDTIYSYSIYSNAVQCTKAGYAGNNVLLYALNGVCISFTNNTSDEIIDLFFENQQLEKRTYTINLIPNEREAAFKMTYNNKEYFGTTGEIRIISIEPTVVAEFTLEALTFKDIEESTLVDGKLTIGDGEFNAESDL